MGRPIKEGMDYFPHDTDASNDEKIEALRALHGNDGYAFYFILLERIYRTNNAELDVSEPAVLAALIGKINVTKNQFYEILATSFALKCFDKDAYERRSVITSKGIKRRHKEVEEMRKRWRKRRSRAKVITRENAVVNAADNAGETPQRKEKKRKEKKSIIYINKTQHGDYVFLSDEEYAKLCGAYGQQRVNDMIDTMNNWLAQEKNRNKYSDHYRALLNWFKKRGEKPTGRDHDDSEKFRGYTG